jgi:hypothetical protein
VLASVVLHDGERIPDHHGCSHRQDHLGEKIIESE